MTYEIVPSTSKGRVPFSDGETWYRITGDLSSGVTPLVIAHGGPGATHQYLLSLTALAAARPVIHYDQLGCGNSTHLQDADPSYWTVDLFLAELDNLLEQLGIADDYHLLGQSWGGMLASEHAVRRPAGLQRLVISNSPASMPLWREACRVVPNPAEVAAAFASIDADPTVYHTMNGPSEFHVVGSLKDWTIVDRLPEIAVPTLVISGAYDEAQPVCVAPYAKLIPDARWEVFQESSHLPNVEEPERYLSVVESFLRGTP
jgi:L-proline amide hydrolase